MGERPKPEEILDSLGRAFDFDPNYFDTAEEWVQHTWSDDLEPGQIKVTFADGHSEIRESR